MNIHRRPRLAKYRTLSNALLFVRRSLSRLFAISLRNSIDTQQRMKWKMDWYRPGQQTLNHITLIKVIICIYIYTRHSTIMSFDSTDVRFTCTNRRKNENHVHVFVQQQFSHFVQHNSCVRQSAIFAFIFFAKKEDWAHTHTHIKDRSSVLELFTLVFLLPNHAENSKWWLRWKDGRNHSFSDGKLYFIVTLTKFDFQRYIYFIRIFHSRFSFFLSQRCHLFSSHQLCTS